MPDLVILGPPGSGKGTQAKPLAEEHGLTYVSTGQLLREAGGEPPGAVLIDVPDGALVERLSGRRICAAEGHEYHVKFRPPAREGVCDIDGSELVRRGDDEPETIQNRLRVYHDQTEPLIAYYEERGRLRRVEGDAPPDDVAHRLAAAVE